MRRHAPLTKEEPSTIDALSQQDIRARSSMCPTNDQIISYNSIAMKKSWNFWFISLVRDIKQKLYAYYSIEKD